MFWLTLHQLFEHLEVMVHFLFDKLLDIIENLFESTSFSQLRYIKQLHVLTEFSKFLDFCLLFNKIWISFRHFIQF